MKSYIHCYALTTKQQLVYKALLQDNELIESKDNNHPEADAGIDQTVSEGSLVFLNGHVITAKTDNEKVFYSWSQVPSENYDVNISKSNTSNPVFKVPYIIDDSNNGHVKHSITLRFQLVVSDSKGTSSKSYVNIKVKRVQRAILFIQPIDYELIALTCYFIYYFNQLFVLNRYLNKLIFL